MFNPGKKLRERLARPDILVLPGVYDALSAKVAVQAGFDGLVIQRYKRGMGSFGSCVAVYIRLL